MGKPGKLVIIRDRYIMKFTCFALGFQGNTIRRICENQVDGISREFSINMYLTELGAI